MKRESLQRGQTAVILIALFVSPEVVTKERWLMKPVGLFSIVLFILVLGNHPLHAAVTLNAGDVWTYEFTSLPEVVPATGLGSSEAGVFLLQVAGFEAGTDVVEFEIYENSLFEPLLASAVVEAVTDGIVANDAWADRQGVGRIHVVSGQVDLQSVTFFRQEPSGPNDWVRYTLNVTPVPEPSTAMLGIIGIGVSVILHLVRTQKRLQLHLP